MCLPRNAALCCTAGVGRGRPVAPAGSVARGDVAGPPKGEGAGAAQRAPTGGGAALLGGGGGDGGGMMGERVDCKRGPCARHPFNPCKARELGEVLVPTVLHDEVAEEGMVAAKLRCT